MSSSTQQNRQKSGAGSCSAQNLASITSINEPLSQDTSASGNSPAQVPVWRSTRSLSSRNGWCGSRDGGDRCKCRCSLADMSLSDEKAKPLVLQATHNKDDEKPDEKPDEKKEEERSKTDFSYLKENLSADYDGDEAGKGGSSGQACGNELDNVEKILQNMQEHLDQIAKSTRAREAKTKYEVYKLKRHLNDLSCMMAYMEQGRDNPYQVRMQGKLGKIERKCAHTGRHLDQKRDRLADLKNLYEQSLLMTPTDVNWPFVHLIASNLPTADEPDLQDCSSEENFDQED